MDEMAKSKGDVVCKTVGIHLTLSANAVTILFAIKHSILLRHMYYSNKPLSLNGVYNIPRRLACQELWMARSRMTLSLYHCELGRGNCRESVGKVASTSSDVR